MRKLIAQFMKFGLVGIISFFIDLGLYIILLAVGVHYLISATVAFTVSVVFNYVFSMRYVFRHKEGMSRKREFIIFAVLSFIGLGFNDAIIWIGVDHFGGGEIVWKMIATAMVTMWNFVTRKRFLDAGE